MNTKVIQGKTAVYTNQVVTATHLGEFKDHGNDKKNIEKQDNNYRH